MHDECSFPSWIFYFNFVNVINISYILNYNLTFIFLAIKRVSHKSAKFIAYCDYECLDGTQISILIWT